ncbi:hypothetical protein [Metarhizobium album]|uniref:hypothetical protein n=1 Tax=Metarhizobium album TaxID=2182425 RepID=UPI00197ED117|nr:hypothetical protein [Rhizobium album]
MAAVVEFDAGLFGTWPAAPVYDGRSTAEREAEDGLQAAARRVVLEVKSREDGGEDLRLLLNDMTREMRAQFDYFRQLRGAAERLTDGEADEAAAKAARADVKAATDAMSLIVRTLEKVDALQRQLAHDRAMEAERHVDTAGLADARTYFLSLIDSRAAEEAGRRFEQFKRDWLAARAPPGADDGGGQSQDSAGAGGG